MDINKQLVLNSLEELDKSILSLFEKIEKDTPEINIILKHLDILKKQFVEDSKEIKTYAEAVKRLALKKDKYEIAAKEVEHKLVIYSEFFAHNKESCYVFLKDLENPIFKDENFLFIFKLYLSQDIKFNLILETENLKNVSSEFLYDILFYANQNNGIKVSVASNYFLEKIKGLFSNNAGHSFFVSGNSFILDADDKCICNFTDKELSKKLKNIF